MVVVKIHKQEKSIIAAVCDEELLGKKFEEGRRQLDLTGDFYAGESKEEAEAGDLIRNADHVNLVGEKSIKLGLHEGIIESGSIMRLGNIPFAQAVVVHE